MLKLRISKALVHGAYALWKNWLTILIGYFALMIVSFLIKSWSMVVFVVGIGDLVAALLIFWGVVYYECLWAIGKGMVVYLAYCFLDLLVVALGLGNSLAYFLGNAASKVVFSGESLVPLNEVLGLSPLQYATLVLLVPLAAMFYYRIRVLKAPWQGFAIIKEGIADLSK